MNLRFCESGDMKSCERFSCSFTLRAQSCTNITEGYGCDGCEVSKKKKKSKNRSLGGWAEGSCKTVNWECYG